MEKATRVCSRLLKSRIDLQSTKSLKKKRRNSKDHVVQKITSKFTVQRKSLNYAVKSVLVQKGQKSLFTDNSKALINKNLFNIVDFKSPACQNIEQTRFPAKILPINEITEIEEKFKELGPVVDETNDFYLISDKNLKDLVTKKITQTQIPNFWERAIENFLIFCEYKPNILNSIIENQNRINEFASICELKLKFDKTPLSETFLKRKITRNCNTLSEKQNLGWKNMSNTEKTPKKSFPNTSFRTPENQKISVKDFEVSSIKLTPAIFKNNKYIEINKETLTNFTDFNISERQKNFFLSEILKQEKMETLNLGGVFDRPRKLKTGCVKRKLQTPYRAPNRRLEFSEATTDDLDFTFLEPALLGSQQVPDLSSDSSRKRLHPCPAPLDAGPPSPALGLEALLSPAELQLRRRAQGKRRRWTPPPPPNFTYQPNYYF